MSFVRLILCVELFLSCILTTQVVVESATIYVALYNYIPDLNEDSLESYKNLVESEFKNYCNDKHDVMVVVDEEYDPYSSDLKKYLKTFDIIEIDAVKLDELVKPEDSQTSLVMSLDEMGLKGSIEKDMFPPAVEAMTDHEDGTIYGYPTLLCGNVVTSIDPVSTTKCPIDKGRVSLTEYKSAFTTCKESFLDSPGTGFETLLVGKLNDADGWYLPYIYLDGYIDKYGKSSLTKAVKELEEKETVDSALCNDLNWFIGLCQDKSENKCEDGSMSTSDIQDSIKNRKGVVMFSFSEELAEVLKKCSDNSRKPQALASVSLGNDNYMLQFTDGLVVSKERWMAHEEDKRDAIKQFVKMFTSSTFRYKLAYGVDLNKPQVRYLLIPNKAFYEAPSPAAFDPIYMNAQKFLQEAVPAPALTDKSKVQDLLEKKCLQSIAPKKRALPKRKSEL